MKFSEIVERLEKIEEAVENEASDLEDAKTAAEECLAQINDRIEKLEGVGQLICDLYQDLPEDEDDDEEEEEEAQVAA